MSFAIIYKKRNHDLWLVEQGRRLRDGNATGGEAIFQGSGSVEIARFIPKCRSTYKASEPIDWDGIQPAPKVFGYQPSLTLQRYVLSMNLWEDELGGVYGNLSLGNSYKSPFVLHVRLPFFIEVLGEEAWMEEAWETLQTAFSNAEQFKA